MKDIVILGAGGFAQEVAWLIEQINEQEHQYNLLGFVNKQAEDDLDGAYPIVGDDQWLLAQRDICVALGIGNPALNFQLIQKLKSGKIFFPNLIHPSVMLPKKSLEIGQGNIFCARNIFTVNIKIGSFNIFNLNSTYGHDFCVSDFSVFSPGLNISGCVRVGDKCLIGTGSTIREKVSIVSDVTIGAASLVLNSIQEDGVYIGSPVRKLIKNK